MSLGKRTLKHLDYGKMASTFVNVATGEAVRVVARDDARERTSAYAPDVADPRNAQIAAYQVMPEADLLRLHPVVIRLGWLDRKRVRLFCQLCGEGVNCGLEVISGDLTVCRPCFTGAYYELPTDFAGATSVTISAPPKARG